MKWFKSIKNVLIYLDIDKEMRIVNVTYLNLGDEADQISFQAVSARSYKAKWLLKTSLHCRR